MIPRQRGSGRGVALGKDNENFEGTARVATIEFFLNFVNEPRPTGYGPIQICIHVPAIMSNTVAAANSSFYVYHKASYQIPRALISFRANRIIDRSINVQENATARPAIGIASVEYRRGY